MKLAHLLFILLIKQPFSITFLLPCRCLMLQRVLLLSKQDQLLLSLVESDLVQICVRLGATLRLRRHFLFNTGIQTVSFYNWRKWVAVTFFQRLKSCGLANIFLL